jgi:acetolactate synthase-1/3 small subunit
VHLVRDLTQQGLHIERELALIKVVNKGESRIEALRIADTFRANTLDSTLESFVFEVTGSSSKISAFVELMRSLGHVEVSRTGVSAISRGLNVDMPIRTQNETQE